MDKFLVFENPGQISILDLISMGDSDKRDDDSKIGKFDSGLKYAMAILFRNNIKFEIQTNTKSFIVDSKVLSDEDTRKTKEVLVVNESSFDDNEEIDHITGFSPKLGHEWKLWMAFREVYSNCLDEDGQMYQTNKLSVPKEPFTQFVITIDSKVQEILNNWDDYFLKENLIDSTNNIEIHENTSDHLKIYKNGILVYENLDKKSLWSYNCNSIEIDEMRCARLDSNFEYDLRAAIISSKNEMIINTLCDNESGFYELTIDYDYGNKFSELWVGIVNSRFSLKNLRLCSNIKKALSSDDRIVMDVIRIPSHNAIYSWDRVSVNLIPDEELDLSFEDNIKKIASDFNFKIKYEIIESKIDSCPVLGDKRNKKLYITNKFCEDDMWQLVQAHFNIDSTDNAFIYKEYVKLLKNKI